MSPDDQTAVNRTVSNVGKALEAYMRNVATGPSPVDEYLSGKKDALTDVERRGLTVFARSGCLDCHNGSQLSDNEFHNLGVPAAAGQEPDPGRAAAISILDGNPFNASGPFFDGTPPAPVDETPVLGGFRTPSLRNLPKSSPYGHNGTFATLEDVVDFHLQGGGKDTSTFVGDVDRLLEPQTLSDGDRNALVEFLKALSGSYPPLPWGQWPNGNG
jgi:cytochrome c peroxidase